MVQPTIGHISRLWLLGVIALGLSACAADPRTQPGPHDALTAQDLAPMSGEALLQRKAELLRAHQDMTGFRKTLEYMHDRSDDRGIESFRPFMITYMEKHLEPLLHPAWQSSHPELILVDANLRFVQAEILLQLDYASWIDDVLDELVERYKGRDHMLVGYPIGRQSTLREALRILRDREWRS